MIAIARVAAGRLLPPAGFAVLFGWLSWQLGGDGMPDLRAYHFYNGYAAADRWSDDRFRPRHTLMALASLNGR